MIRRARPSTFAIAVAVTLLVAACSGLPSIVPTPESRPVPAAPTFGPTDRALARLDPEAVMKHVRGGERCRPTPPDGSYGGDDYWHMVAGFSCQRFGNDRDVWFEFADAWGAELEALGSAGGSGGGSGDPEDPLVADWDIRGETRVGTSRLIGVNGPGTLQILVSMDLVAP
jgi:hypothetical protein